MNDDEFDLERLLARELPASVRDQAAPPFASSWQAAERRFAATRRRRRQFGTAAALIVAIAGGLLWQAPGQREPRYIETAELLGSTSWSAPSDVLLPQREFDIYQELPVLIESTETAGGSLL